MMKIAAFYENIMDGIKNSGKSEQEVLAHLHEVGMDKIYMSYQSLNSREVELMKMFSEIGLEVEGLFWFFEFGKKPEDDGYKDTIDLAKRAGAGNVLLVPGMIVEENSLSRQQQMDNMKQAMRKAVQYGKEQGVAVTMEDFDGKEAPYCTIEGLKWFMDEVEGLTCSFDTGNFIMYHQDEMEAFECFKNKIVTMHIKDRSMKKLNENDKACVCTDGISIYPAPVGMGYIRIREIIDKLKEMGYNGTLIVELFLYDDDEMINGIEKSIKWVKQVIGEENDL